MSCSFLLCHFDRFSCSRGGGELPKPRHVADASTGNTSMPLSQYLRVCLANAYSVSQQHCILQRKSKTGLVKRVNINSPVGTED